MAKVAVARSSVTLNDIAPIGHAEAISLAQSQNEAILCDLRSLRPEDWDRPTDCVGWAVRDLVAHLLGWAEALTSVREATGQTAGAVRRRKGFPSLVDAQNEVQVDARRWLSADELIARLEYAFPRFLKVRNVAGRVFRRVPYMTGPTGWTNVGFIADHIFTRDVFMHRIDITRALGDELEVGPDERRIVESCLHEWAVASGADATLDLTGAAGGRYVAGSGTAVTITGDSIDLLRWFAGRTSLDAFEIEGSHALAVDWLGARVKF